MELIIEKRTMAILILLHTIQSYGGNASFLPINEIERLGISLAIDNTTLKTNLYSSRQLQDFYNSEGFSFNTYSASISWSQITLDRGLFPTNGIAIHLD